MRGATPEINELAAFLRTMTAETTVRDLANRYRGGKTLWSLYRSGARVVPWHLLERVVTDRVGDVRGRTIALSRARYLHSRAEASADAVAPAGPAPAAPAPVPEPEPEDNSPTSKDNAHRRWWELVAACVLAVVCTIAVVRPQAAEPAEVVPAAPTAPAGLYAVSGDRGSVL